MIDIGALPCKRVRCTGSWTCTFKGSHSVDARGTSMAVICTQITLIDIDAGGLGTCKTLEALTAILAFRTRELGALRILATDGGYERTLQYILLACDTSVACLRLITIAEVLVISTWETGSRQTWVGTFIRVDNTGIFIQITV